MTPVPRLRLLLSLLLLAAPLAGQLAPPATGGLVALEPNPLRRKRHAVELGAQRIDHVGRTGDPKAAHMDHDGGDKSATDPAMQAPAKTCRERREISANEQGLDQQ